jgi:ATP-dependent helicase HrpB
MPSVLPVDAVLPQVRHALLERGAAVVEAPPGAGKTTRIPRFLLDSGFADRGDIWITEPRRLPARLAALRVAEEDGSPLGGRIGYAVRFDERVSAETRVRFVTEGILVRRLLRDPRLEGTAVVILDEFHERHAATDLLLGVIRELRRNDRPDLKVVVMSATLDAAAIAAYLDDAPRIRSEGRLFEVKVDFLARPDDRPLAEQVAGTVRRAVRENAEGDTLVFLPGAADIRRAGDALAPFARERELLVVPLHGDLPPAEQDRAVRTSVERKVVLATNVAETSITLPRVTAVVDSGLARLASHSPWTGLPTTTVGKVSQASIVQRAGRAGRTAPGIAYRLFTQHDFEGRRAYDLPEIARIDLAEIWLLLARTGWPAVAAFPWITPPPHAAWDAARALLGRLGALDRQGNLTARGRRLAELPVHPRLGRLLEASETHGLAREGATLAALISERDIRVRSFGAAPGEQGIDIFTLLDAFEQAARARFDKNEARRLGLSSQGIEMVDKTRRALEPLLTRSPRAVPLPRDGAERARSLAARDELLGQALLAGFPDRVAARRAAERNHRPEDDRVVVMCGGGTALLGYTTPSTLVLALDAEERGRASDGRSSSQGTVIRLGADVAPEWLLALDEDASDLREEDALTFNPTTERVERRVRLFYGALVLEDRRQPAPPSDEASRLLAAAAREQGLTSFDEPGALATLRGRLAVLRAGHAEAKLPSWDEGALDEILLEACQGLTTLDELRAVPLTERLASRLPTEVQAWLAAEAPRHVTLPGGRRVEVHYEEHQPPWIASRLQDFFGMNEGPRVGKARLPLTLHLLAPNHRAVQVTQDLAGFWRQHYPALRRELGRRYPRHAWPEDGATATPPAPKVGPRAR